MKTIKAKATEASALEYLTKASRPVSFREMIQCFEPESLCHALGNLGESKKVSVSEDAFHFLKFQAVVGF